MVKAEGFALPDLSYGFAYRSGSRVLGQEALSELVRR